jgi:hypothetical protein
VEGRLLILLPLVIIPLPLVVVLLPILFIFAPCRTYILTSK